jgi:hypothetical protein
MRLFSVSDSAFVCNCTFRAAATITLSNAAFGEASDEGSLRAVNLNGIVCILLGSMKIFERYRPDKTG